MEGRKQCRLGSWQSKTSQEAKGWSMHRGWEVEAEREKHERGAGGVVRVQPAVQPGAKGGRLHARDGACMHWSQVPALAPMCAAPRGVPVVGGARGPGHVGASLSYQLRIQGVEAPAGAAVPTNGPKPTGACCCVDGAGSSWHADRNGRRPGGRRQAKDGSSCSLIRRRCLGERVPRPPSSA